MSRHPFLLDGNSTLIGDASVWINLAATGRIEQIIRTIPGKFAITDTALSELERGRERGRSAASIVGSLVDVGLIEVITLDAESEATFLELVVGSTSETLDDGEAATLACANSSSSIALIDERKAMRIAAGRFPLLQVASTVELMLSPHLRPSFALEEIADALFSALTLASMRVPPEWLESVCDLIGDDRVMSCRSLPSYVRSRFKQGRSTGILIPGQ